MFKKFSYFHLLPFAIACLIAFLFIYSKKNPITKDVVISGSQTMTSGKYGNLLDSQSAELNYMASIKNKDQFTIFGSSEFTNSQFCPYNFFPNSFGIQMLGIGHAYHQNLSILIELLAANEFLDTSTNICILLSPGWFTSGTGTNTEAFIEFAKPNFLARIIQDDNIPAEYKSYLGKFISRNKEEFTSFNPEMEQLQRAYVMSSSNLVNRNITYFKNKVRRLLNPLNRSHTVHYEFDMFSKKHIPRSTPSNIFDKIGDSLKTSFVSKITSNNFFVNDEYYSTYLKKGNVEFEPVNLTAPKIENNFELEDLTLLAKFLESKKVKASFVMIPYNAYCYNNVEVNQPLVDTITNLLKARNLPFLNMYANCKEDYEPGILKDVMHLGDYGWMKVNKFIFETYYEKIK